MDNPWNMLIQLQWEHRLLTEKYDKMLMMVEKILESLLSTERNQVNIKKGKGQIKCKYFNRGFCRETKTCQYFHPEILCQEYCETGTCSQGKSCEARHPHSCRHWRKGSWWRKFNTGYSALKCNKPHFDRRNLKSRLQISRIFFK